MNTLITKQLVLEALRNEPVFFSGNWVRARGYGEPEEGDCPVCAVGSVMRTFFRREEVPPTEATLDYACQASANEGNCDYTAGVPNRFSIPLLDPRRNEYWQALVDRNPLAALSKFFETTSSPMIRNLAVSIIPEASTDDIRQACIQFVHRFFPAKFELPAGEDIAKELDPESEAT